MPMHKVDMVAASISSNPNFIRFCQMPVFKEIASITESMALFSCFEERCIKSGTTIYETGSVSEREMFMILEGQVSVSDASGNIYASLKQGDVFGLFSFLDKRPHSATVIARQDIVALTMTRPYFDMLTRADPALGNQLLHFMFRLLSQMALTLEVEYAALRQYALGVRR